MPLSRNRMPYDLNLSNAAFSPMVPNGPLVIISPHLDDAVFSCGSLLSHSAGSTVVTVFTGVPHEGGILTEWDRECGFLSAAEAMRAREAEDCRALEAIRCCGRSLGFIDCQYQEHPDHAMPALMESLLSTVIDLAPGRVGIPLGLFHGDHLRVSEAALRVRQLLPDIAWFFYEDAPYRAHSGVVQARLVQLYGRGMVLTPACGQADLGSKEVAIAAYVSQLKAFNGVPDDLRRPERYWHIEADVQVPSHALPEGC
jgi:LmbE family N-acetylglucosaminyl deacetylase